MTNIGLLLSAITISTASLENISLSSSPYDTEECDKQYSLLADFMKGNEFNYARDAWRYIYNTCPERFQGIYVYGAQIWEFYIEQEKNDEIREKYIDTLLAMYDKRIEMAQKDPGKFGEPGYVLGRKAIEFSTYRKNDVKTGYEMFRRSVNTQGNKSESYVMMLYMQSAARMRAQKAFGCDTIVSIFEKLMEICDYNISSGNDEYQTAMATIEQLAGNCLDCSALIESYTKAFDMNKTNNEWLKRSAANLEKKNCAGKDEFKKSPIIEKIFVENAKLNPNADGYRNLAAFFVSTGKNKEAEEYFAKAAELETDNVKKSLDLYNIAAINAGNKNYSAARTLALRAANLRSGWGEPFILIGDMYAASTSSCAGEGVCTRGGALWAAYDKYQYAKSIDASVSEKANRKMGTVSANFPSQGDCFFETMKDGDSFTVNCWINESTTVRTKKD